MPQVGFEPGSLAYQLYLNIVDNLNRSATTASFSVFCLFYVYKYSVSAVFLELPLFLYFVLFSLSPSFLLSFPEFYFFFLSLVLSLSFFPFSFFFLFPFSFFFHLLDCKVNDVILNGFSTR